MYIISVMIYLKDQKSVSSYSFKYAFLELLDLGTSEILKHFK